MANYTSGFNLGFQTAAPLAAGLNALANDHMARQKYKRELRTEQLGILHNQMQLAQNLRAAHPDQTDAWMLENNPAYNRAMHDIMNNDLVKNEFMKPGLRHESVDLSGPLHLRTNPQGQIAITLMTKDGKFVPVTKDGVPISQGGEIDTLNGYADLGEYIDAGLAWTGPQLGYTTTQTLAESIGIQGGLGAGFSTQPAAGTTGTQGQQQPPSVADQVRKRIVEPRVAMQTTLESLDTKIGELKASGAQDQTTVETIANLENQRNQVIDAMAQAELNQQDVARVARLQEGRTAEWEASRQGQLAQQQADLLGKLENVPANTTIKDLFDPNSAAYKQVFPEGMTDQDKWFLEQVGLASTGMWENIMALPRQIGDVLKGEGENIYDPATVARMKEYLKDQGARLEDQKQKALFEGTAFERQADALPSLKKDAQKLEDKRIAAGGKLSLEETETLRNLRTTIAQYEQQLQTAGEGKPPVFTNEMVNLMQSQNVYVPLDSMRPDKARNEINKNPDLYLTRTGQTSTAKQTDLAPKDAKQGWAEGRTPEQQLAEQARLADPFSTPYLRALATTNLYERGVFGDSMSVAQQQANAQFIRTGIFPQDTTALDPRDELERQKLELEIQGMKTERARELDSQAVEAVSTLLPEEEQAQGKLTMQRYLDDPDHGELVGRAYGQHVTGPSLANMAALAALVRDRLEQEFDGHEHDRKIPSMKALALYGGDEEVTDVINDIGQDLNMTESDMQSLVSAARVEATKNPRAQIVQEISEEDYAKIQNLKLAE